MVAFEQTKFPVVVQDLDQRNPLAVKRLLSVRGRLEVLERSTSSSARALRARASSALTASSQQGPLLLRHDPSVGPAEFLYPMTFRFGELSCELVKIAYRVGFVVGCPLCLPEFAPHDEQRKSERQRVHDVERCIDRTDGGVVRFSQRQGQVTLYENLSHERAHDAHQNNHDAPKCASQRGQCGSRPFVCIAPVSAKDSSLAIGRQGRKMLRPSSTLRPCETLRTRNLIAYLGEGGTLRRLALLRLRGSGKSE